MRTKHTCYTYFFITGIFNPEEISKRLDLIPMDKWSMEKFDENGQQYEESFWQFGLCDNYNPQVSYMMKETIKPLLGKEIELKKIKEEYHVKMFLEITCGIDIDEALPSFALSPDIIDFLHDSGVEIDFDLYIDESDDATA